MRKITRRDFLASGLVAVGATLAGPAIWRRALAAPAQTGAPGGLGGAGAIRFDADGGIVDAYPILTGTSSNCAGGPTPWNTWLSCEETETPGRRCCSCIGRRTGNKTQAEPSGSRLLTPSAHDDVGR